jgi:mRNA interferase MazF
MALKQYQIILVDLSYTNGSKIMKTRPCVIVSPDEMNRFLRTVIVAPMTTQSRTYPSRVRIKQNKKTGWIVLDQIRTIDKKRIIKSLGKLQPREISKTKNVLREMLVE